MASSFLNIPGLPLGLRNNNPGNLRPLPGGQKWKGEIAPDLVNGFSRFSDVAWGLRAMITDLSGDIVNDKLDTIRKLVTAYAPPSENNTIAYINAVSKELGISPDAKLPGNQDTIRQLVLAKLKVELGAAQATKITAADLEEAFTRISNTVRSWLNMAPGGTSGGLVILVLVGLAFMYRKQLF